MEHQFQEISYSFSVNEMVFVKVSCSGQLRESVYNIRLFILKNAKCHETFSLIDPISLYCVAEGFIGYILN